MSFVREFRHPVVPRWPAAIALVAISLMYMALPERLRVGPPWLMLAIVGLLVVVLLLFHQLGNVDASHWLGHAATALVTFAVALSAFFLVTRLPSSKVPGEDLLKQAALIWVANILVFGCWYWEIDGGGPRARRLDSYHSQDFVFPQFQQDPSERLHAWMPHFVDYMFLAFNTSTAFSPTDTLVLSQRAKALMMVQGLISLVVIGVLAARAINTI
jgi:hypothetical protein